METSVVIVQHGEKEPGSGDPGLTKRGHRQVDFAAAALVSLRPVALVSSPLRRAKQTAESVARRCGLQVVCDKRLRERMNLEVGQDISVFLRDWRRTVQDRSWSPEPDGRSSRATAVDMMQALQTHAVEGEAVIFASHGGATVDLLRDLLGDEELEGRAPGVISNGVGGAALTTLVRRKETWIATHIATVDHIPPNDRTGHVPR